MAAGPRGEGFISRAISLSQVRLQSALQRQLPLPDTPSLLKNIFFPLVFGCSKTVWAVSCAAKGCCCLWEEKNSGGSTRGQKSVPYHGVHTALCCPRPQILIQETRLQIHLWLCGTSIGPDSPWLFAEWCFPHSVAWIWTLNYFK